MLRPVLVTLFVMLAGSAIAQDSRLERLDVGDAARQWEAVGRLGSCAERNLDAQISSSGD